jgi:predicted nucleic acid-binding protein
MHNGARAVIPALWHLEVANSLGIAERRGILDGPDVERSLDNFEKLLAVSIDTDSTLISAREALAAARPYGLSAYDGAYLYLARRHGWPLATLDEKLRLAARRAGVSLLQ